MTKEILKTEGKEVPKEIKKTYIKSIFVFALIGLVMGGVLGEYTNIGGTFWDLLSRPFSTYRNRISFHYALMGLLIGAIVGFVIHWIYYKPSGITNPKPTEIPKI